MSTRDRDYLCDVLAKTVCADQFEAVTEVSPLLQQDNTKVLI